MANGSSNGSNGTTGRPWIRITTIVVLVLVLIGVYVHYRHRRIRVTVVKAAYQALSSSIATNGKVEPVQGFEAHAPLAVTVRRVLVKEGSQVTAGQLLLELDDARAKADVATAETRVKSAEERLANLKSGGTPQQLLLRRNDQEKTTSELQTAERHLAALQRLQQSGAASSEEVAAARDRLTRAQADQEQLQAPVRYSTPELTRAQGELSDARAALQASEDVLRQCDVRAPFAGTVYFLPAKAGAFVQIGDLLLQEADLSQLQVRAFVDEPEIGRLALGQTVRITWDALPGKFWQGTVASLPSTVINRGSRVVGEVLCRVDNTARLLLPNVNVNATIVSVSKENALSVPREAVREDATHSYVFVVDGGELRRRDVTLGIANLTHVEILNGIGVRDVIAVQSLSPSPLADGVAVKIVENPS